jgi:hypothetical protein
MKVQSAIRNEAKLAKPIDIDNLTNKKYVDYNLSVQLITSS